MGGEYTEDGTDNGWGGFQTFVQERRIHRTAVRALGQNSEKSRRLTQTQQRAGATGVIPGLCGEVLNCTCNKGNFFLILKVPIGYRTSVLPYKAERLCSTRWWVGCI